MEGEGPSYRTHSGRAKVDPAAHAIDLTNAAARYQLEQKLGVGSMGEVHLCKDRRIGREVARKVLLKGHGADATLRARFLREARIQGQLEHPSIVPVHDLGADEAGAPYFTMKALNGLTLREVLTGLAAGDAEIAQQFSQRRLLAAFSSVCLAVDFAHSRGVIHRDLKPSNVMLGDYGEVYVLDWGIAKVRQDTTTGEAHLTESSSPSRGLPRLGPVDTPDDIHTAVGKILGTFGYMAPEQARGAIAEIDARTDVYSLGAILFEILTLKPLHAKTAWKQMFYSTLKGASARASERAPERAVAPELEEICVKATHLEKRERFQSARELNAAVERYLDGDRDLELRRRLAQEHARAAEAQAAAAAARGGEAEVARNAALREVGRTLALDPGNAPAMQVLAELVAVPPARLPGAVRAELTRAAAERMRFQLRAGIFLDLAILALVVPMAFWMGIRAPALLVAIAVMTLAAAAMKALSSSQTRVGRGHVLGFAAYALNVGSLLLMSRAFGSLVFVPTLLATLTLGYSMSHRASYRATVLATGCLALLASAAIEATGLLPRMYAFHDGAMTILPQAVTLTATPTLVTLAASALIMTFFPGLMMGRLQTSLRQAELRSILQTYHLRQLVPEGAREPIAGG